jgi:two-component system, chemotaxis family, chemotaxis protein CheY
MKTVLIVDDSPTIRRMLKATLAGLPAVTFLEAGTGLQAIEQLTLARVALMLLDLNMPDMHGLEVLAFVRRHPTYRTLPVIVLTTRGDEQSREKATAAGATLYLTKPFQPSALAEHVRALLEEAGSFAAEDHSRVR